MTRQEFEYIAPMLHLKVLKVGLAFFDSYEDAEDAAQETMEQLWRYCEHIDERRNIGALAIRVAKNCCVSLFRSPQRKVVSLDVRPPNRGNVDVAPSPQELLEAEDTKRILTEVMSLLSPRERQLVEMRSVFGLSTKEISEQTGIPKNSVASMVSTARKKMYTELKRRMNQ